MPRVKRSTKRNDRRKKILKRASGYFLTKSKLYQAAQEAVERSLMFAYTGRKQKKRQFRSLWIVRINAAAKLNGMSYSHLHPRPQGRRRRARPQDARRHRSERRCRLYHPRRAGEDRFEQLRGSLAHTFLRPQEGASNRAFSISIKHHGYSISRKSPLRLAGAHRRLCKLSAAQLLRHLIRQFIQVGSLKTHHRLHLARL